MKKYKIFKRLQREKNIFEKSDYMIGNISDVKKESITMNELPGERYNIELLGAGTLGVQIEANGYHGGDAGHGARASIKLENLASYCFINGNYDSDKVEFTVGGDEECRLLISALRKSADSLEEIMNNYTEK